MSIPIAHFEQSTKLRPFFEGVNEFCRRHLPFEGPPEDEDAGAKIFADPVQHYATLAPWEASIVDTALFQRLRGIRQLGMAYFVYPTLGYSRFEHTIGVTARFDQVIRNLQDNLRLGFYKSRLPPLPTQEQVLAARLACLLHDAGHCLFSHVSEAVIERLRGDDQYPSSEEIVTCFSAYAGRRIPMAEVFAVAMLISPSFIRYLGQLDIPAAKKNRTLLGVAAAHLVMGMPIPDDPHSLFLAQLMSSGLDVDKLDYMLRESHFTGITLGVSLDWLLKKLQIRELSAEQVPEGLKARIRRFPVESIFAVLGLDRGGQFAFEEFCVARLALHEKIYLHQKIRAAEAEMKDILSKMAQNTPLFNQAHRWLYLKESALDFPSMDLPTLPMQSGLFDAGYERNLVKLGVDRLQARRLMFRAFGFGWQNAVAEPLVEERFGTTSPTDSLMAYIEGNTGEFLAKVRSNLREIQMLLTHQESPDVESIPVLIDLPRLSSIQQGYDTIFFEHPSRLPVRWTMPIDKIVDYYHRNRALGYMFSTRAHIPYVLLAAERAVWDLFKVIYVQDGCVNSHILAGVRELRESLHKLDYYEDAPELQPVSEFLNSVDAQNAISKVASKLALFDPRSKRYVSPASVTTYVAQFPGNLQEAALCWLDTIDWINPSEFIQEALAKALKDEPLRSAKRIGFCPLGASTDSASRIAYNLRDMEGQLLAEDKFVISPLAEALGRKLDAYVLYDDNINTGKQALNIVSAWLGRSLPNAVCLNERHVFELPSGDKSELLQKPIVFLFAVGVEGANEELVILLDQYCGANKDLVTAFLGKTLTKDERCFSGSKSSFQHQDNTQLTKFVREVAVKAFVDEGKTPEEAAARALGYGAAEAMIVFPYNCPTMTVPALWLTGRVNGKKWIPLVERTRRTNPQTGIPIGEDS